MSGLANVRDLLQHSGIEAMTMHSKIRTVHSESCYAENSKGQWVWEIKGPKEN